MSPSPSARLRLLYQFLQQESVLEQHRLFAECIIPPTALDNWYDGVHEEKSGYDVSGLWYTNHNYCYRCYCVYTNILIFRTLTSLCTGHEHHHISRSHIFGTMIRARGLIGTPLQRSRQKKARYVQRIIFVYLFDVMHAYTSTMTPLIILMIPLTTLLWRHRRLYYDVTNQAKALPHPPPFF